LYVLLDISLARIRPATILCRFDGRNESVLFTVKF
jgi:hypothetical protein